MKRILLTSAIVIAVGAFLFIALGASNSSNAVGTYKIEIDNAFGLVKGADFKVAGVRAGTINRLDLCYSDPGALPEPVPRAGHRAGHRARPELVPR